MHLLYEPRIDRKIATGYSSVASSGAWFPWVRLSLNNGTFVMVEHRSVIWITELGPGRLFEVRTAEGFAVDYGANPKSLVASNLKDGRPLADALGIPLVGYEAALEFQERKAQQVSFGDVIIIEGRKYEVRHRPGGHAWDEVDLVPQT